MLGVMVVGVGKVGEVILVVGDEGGWGLVKELLREGVSES